MLTIKKTLSFRRRRNLVVMLDTPIDPNLECILVPVYNQHAASVNS
jgi:hypothetical protein